MCGLEPEGDASRTYNIFICVAGPWEWPTQSDLLEIKHAAGRNCIGGGTPFWVDCRTKKLRLRVLLAFNSPLFFRISQATVRSCDWNCHWCSNLCSVHACDHEECGRWYVCSAFARLVIRVWLTESLVYSCSRLERAGLYPAVSETSRA